MNKEIKKLVEEEIGEEFPEWEIVDVQEFEPKEEDYEYGACCFCCAGSNFVEVLIKKGSSEYKIPRYSIYTGGFGTICFSHDIMKDGQHPFSNYKQIIRGYEEHPYNKFLIRNKIKLDPNFFGKKAKKWQKKY